jgi:hypothetical protein
LADADRLARSKLIAYLARRFTAEDFPRFSSLLALLDEPAILRPNLRHARTRTTAHARRATANDALGMGMVRAVSASRAARLRDRRHPVGAECPKR